MRQFKVKGITTGRNPKMVEGWGYMDGDKCICISKEDGVHYILSPVSIANQQIQAKMPEKNRMVS